MRLAGDRAMNVPRRYFLQFAVAAGLAPLPGIARAQSYPSRPITIIVPFAAGGPLDISGRILAAKMQQILGQPVIIENVGGGAGSIGLARVARADPDGYTLGLGIWTTHVVNAALYDLSYDVQKDFAPVALYSDGPLILVGRKTLPANDLKELIGWLKANPDKATAGTAGVGSPQHVFGTLFENVTGTHFQFAHYRGGGQATQDLVGGQIDIVFSDAITALPQIKAGTIKAFAIMAKSRMAQAPDIPTADEAGVPGLYSSVWNALWAPKGTPQPIIDKLNAAVVAALADPEVRQHLLDIGRTLFPPDQLTPKALADLQKSEIEKWWPIIKAAGMKGE
jgi:tripartite-type tricarboxylate transporter receptor subunit TctC